MSSPRPSEAQAPPIDQEPRNEHILLDDANARISVDDDFVRATFHDSAVDTPVERQAVGMDYSQMFTNLVEAQNNLEFWPELTQLFNSSVAEAADGRVTVQTPRSAVLNTMRADPAFVATGANTATLVDVSYELEGREKGALSGVIFAQHLAAGEVAFDVSDPGLTVHDQFSHRLFYAVLCQGVMGRYMSWAKQATEEGDVDLANKVFSSMDTLTGDAFDTGIAFGLDGPNVDMDRKIEFWAKRYYSDIVGEEAALAAAKQDVPEQLAASQKLIALAGSVS